MRSTSCSRWRSSSDTRALTWRALRGRAARHPDRQRVGAVTSPFAFCIYTILGLGLARIADRLFDDRRLDPVSAARGPRPWHLGRADSQRPLQQLRAAGRAAVLVLGRADERQQDDRSSAAVLRHAGRPLPRRSRPHQHRPEHHLCRHVRLGHCRPCRHRAASAST